MAQADCLEINNAKTLMKLEQMHCYYQIVQYYAKASLHCWTL